MKKRDLLRCLMLSLLFVVCLLLFLMQSYREIHKYFTNLTSTSLRTHREYNVTFPILVVCNRRAFRTDDYILTFDDYAAAVFTYDETFRNESFYPSTLMRDERTKITAIDSVVHGRCYKIDLHKDIKMSDFVGIGVRAKSNLRIHVMEDGQELCIQYGSCPDIYETVEPNEDHFEFWLTVVKSLKPKRDCGPKTTAEQFECIKEELAREMQRNLACFPPLIARAMAEYPTLANRGECRTKEEINATRHLAVELNFRLLRNMGDRCPQSCQKWIYHAEKRPYNKEALNSMFGNSWDSAIYFMSLRDSIDVSEEFVVYDESGILAALGGSLGLFLGFSFFDCGAALIRQGCRAMDSRTKREEEEETKKEGASLKKETILDV